jgi:transposase-like protein
VRACVLGIEPVLGPACGRTRGISAINKRLDESLAQFAHRRLVEAFPYLILDARYERVREAGVIARQAVLVAIGIDWDGRRQVLGVELANRETRSSWRIFSWACASAVCRGSSSSSPMTMLS